MTFSRLIGTTTATVLGFGIAATASAQAPQDLACGAGRPRVRRSRFSPGRRQAPAGSRSRHCRRSSPLRHAPSKVIPAPSSAAPAAPGDSGCSVQGYSDSVGPLPPQRRAGRPAWLPPLPARRGLPLRLLRLRPRRTPAPQACSVGSDQEHAGVRRSGGSDQELPGGQAPVSRQPRRMPRPGAPSAPIKSMPTSVAPSAPMKSYPAAQAPLAPAKVAPMASAPMAVGQAPISVPSKTCPRFPVSTRVRLPR